MFVNDDMKMLPKYKPRDTIIMPRSNIKTLLIVIKNNIMSIFVTKFLVEVMNCTKSAGLNFEICKVVYMNLFKANV